MNDHSLCDVESFCTCRTSACFTNGSAVGLMTKESSINFWNGIVVRNLQSTQTTSVASPVHSQDKAPGPGNKPLISV